MGIHVLTVTFLPRTRSERVTVKQNVQAGRESRLLWEMLSAVARKQVRKQGCAALACRPNEAIDFERSYNWRKSCVMYLLRRTFCLEEVFIYAVSALVAVAVSRVWTCSTTSLLAGDCCLEFLVSFCLLNFLPLSRENDVVQCLGGDCC